MKTRLLAAMFAPVCAMANPLDMVKLVDEACISSGGGIKEVETILLRKGATEADPELIAEDAVIRKFGGKVYVLEVNGQRYTVVVSNIKSCAVAAQGIAPFDVKQQIKRSLQLSAYRPQSTIKDGHAVTWWLYQNHKTQRRGHLILSSNSTGLGMVVVGFVPTETLEKHGDTGQ